GGPTAMKAAAEAARYGLDEVVHLSSPVLETYLALNSERALKEYFSSEQPRAVLAASTAVGKDLLPRLAVHLEAGQASDIVARLPGGKFRRLMYAGNIIAEVEITTPVKVVTVRPSAFSAAKESGTAPVREVPSEIAADDRQKFVSYESVKSERPDLSTA